MSTLPPVGPSTPIGDRDNPADPEPRVRYVSPADAADEDRMTVLDKAAVVAALGVAQLIRLFIIFGAVGLIVLVIFVAQHV